MVDNLALRNALEVAARWAGIAQRQREGYAFIGEHGFDIGELPILDFKAYAGDRDVDDVDQIMNHCTAVTSGFGVQRWGKTGTIYWRRMLVSGEIQELAPNLYEQMDHCGMLLRPDEAVHFLALAARFRNTAYHVIGTQAGYLFRNRRPEQASHHGNGTRKSGGNKGLGVVFDASPKTKLTEWLIATFRAAFRLGHLVWLEKQKGDPGTLRIVSHAQAKWPGRANDPGRELHHRVVVPEVKALREEGHDVVIDTTWHWGTGKVPEWMILR